MAKRRKKPRDLVNIGMQQQRDLEKSYNQSMRTLGLSFPKRKSKSSSKKYYQEEDLFKIIDRLSPREALMILIVIGITALIFVIYFLIEWVKQNILISIIIVAIIIVGIGIYISWYFKKKKEKKEYEKEQISKGLIKFIDRFGNERWGKPNDVKKWTKEDEEAKEKEKLINQIIDEIEKFKPIRKYKNEFPYQIDLARHLKNKFPDTDIEQQKGSSRPDIVVEDVAIEVKGPTRNKDLKTIADKCVRYSQHFGEIVIVLFETEVYERLYDEWVTNIKKYFPRVKIIKK